MLSLGSLAFLNPWLLAGLAALPILWWLLRAIPPSPKRAAFAGVRLLLGLEDEERQSSRTPWWLLALRILAVAAVLIGFSQPVLNPTERLTAGASGPLLVLMDQGWASAPDWRARQEAVRAALDEAERADRPVRLWQLGREGPVPPVADAGAMRSVLDGSAPVPLAPERGQVLAALEDGSLGAPGETLWLHDGLSHDTTAGALMDRLADAGRLHLVGPGTPAPALAPARLQDGRLAVDVLRAGGPAEPVSVIAIARTERGAERRIAVATAEFGAGDTRATAVFELPPDLVREVSRLAISETPSAGGAVLATGAIRRVPVAVVDPGSEDSPTSLTSARHYLREALQPWADVREGDLAAMLESDPAAIVLADYGAIAEPLRTEVTEWIDRGGLLIRFAGPRLAAATAERIGAAEEMLLPVTLRRGGRSLGGSLAWTTPRSLGPFDPEGVFRGLTPPGDVSVRTQVLAEPAPDLSDHVWATLADGTPIVTGAEREGGHVVLFHVTADAEWSSLPLSGLYVEMLGRLMALAPGQAPERPSAEDLAGTLWRADLLMGVDGTPRPAPSTAEPVPGERLAAGATGPALPPGLYARADSAERRPGEASEIVVNLFGQEDTLAPLPAPPAGVTAERLGGAETERLGPWFLAAAIALALADVIATLWISGRLAPRVRAATVAAMVAAVPLLTSTPAEAQEGDMAAAVEATAETTLGYVLTGDPRLDRISARAMEGLRLALTRRTAVEPGPSVGVDPARDELAFYPILYWPLTAGTVLDDSALQRLADYIARGGMLVIDTQGGASGFGTAGAGEMRRIARALNLPPLAPVDGDHVLTRTFYLLDRFPGRWRGGRVWAEAPPPGREEDGEAPTMPRFDRVDDNVSPVVVGSADWAAAWAIDEQGRALVPIGRAGGRQREMAFRFGVNLVMYALTGNYKSDQVHAPEVLRRLGQ